jgi:D-alanyl-lipoteichoic acid acyltransferase DltB (MBOAT superfamily)
VRRYLNLGIVMVLGGFWHGANWTFVVWGGLHGLMLGVNPGQKIAVLQAGFAHAWKVGHGNGGQRRISQRQRRTS